MSWLDSLGCPPWKVEAEEEAQAEMRWRSLRYSVGEAFFSGCDSYQDAKKLKETLPAYKRFRGKYTEMGREYLPVRRQDGKIGRRYEHISGPAYTTLLHCQLCGRIGSPRVIKNRSDVWAWLARTVRLRSKEYEDQHHYERSTWSPNVLCGRCWVIAQEVYQATELLDNIVLLIKKIDIDRQLIQRRLSNESDWNGDRGIEGIARTVAQGADNTERLSDAVENLQGDG